MTYDIFVIKRGDAVEQLNQKVIEGWEFVSFMHYHLDETSFLGLFKRYAPLPEPPKEPEQADLFGDHP